MWELNVNVHLGGLQFVGRMTGLVAFMPDCVRLLGETLNPKPQTLYQESLTLSVFMVGFHVLSPSRECGITRHKAKSKPANCQLAVSGSFLCSSKNHYFECRLLDTSEVSEYWA